MDVNTNGQCMAKHILMRSYLTPLCATLMLLLFSYKAHAVSDGDKLILQKSLYNVIATKACLNSVRDNLPPSRALSIAITGTRQQFPAIAAAIGGIDRDRLVASFTSVCSFIYKRELVYESNLVRQKLQEEVARRHVKPVLVDKYTPAAECKVDSYWLNKLRTSLGFSIENRKCLIDVKARR